MVSRSGKRTLLFLITVLAATWTAALGQPNQPRDPVADAAKLDALTKTLLEGEYRAKLQAADELATIPLGEKVKEDLLLDKALPACAADKEWRLRASVARTIGSRWIWSQAVNKPDPRAVALCLKLAADENPTVRHNAVYFGLSTLREKSDEVIAALLKAGQGDAKADLAGRVEWGLRGTPTDRLLKHVEPILAQHKEHPADALFAYRVFVNATQTEPPGAERFDDIGPWVVEFSIQAVADESPKAALARFRELVPESLVPVIVVRPSGTSIEGAAMPPTLKARREMIGKLKSAKGFRVNDQLVAATPQIAARLTQMSKLPPPPANQQRSPANTGPPAKSPEEHLKLLETGDSQSRLEAFGQLQRSDLFQDERILPGLEAAANDPNPSVRQQVAKALNFWVWNRNPQPPRAVALAVKLGNDPDPGVRYDAVYYGLSTVKTPKSDDVICAMLTAGIAQEKYDDINLHGRIAWGLREETPERLSPLFEKYLNDPNLDRATVAYAMFVQATAYEPPNAERFAPIATFQLWFGQSRDSKHNTPEKLLAAVREYAPAEKVPEVAVYQNGDFAQGAAIFKDLALFRDITTKMKVDPEFYVELRPFVMLPARVAALRAQLAKNPKQTISTINVPPMTYEDVLRDLHAHLGRRYASFAIKNIDWKEVGDELLPLAKDVKTDADFGKLCMRMVARLEDSHAVLQSGSAALPEIEFPRFDPGFACLIDDRDRPVVYHVDKNSPAETSGVKIGMTVLSVNGRSAADAMKSWMDQQRVYAGYSSDRALRYDAAKGFCRQMKQGDLVKLEMEDVAGEKHTFELPATLGIRYLPRLPVPIDGIADSADVSFKSLGDGIGYIYVRRIRADLPQSLDSALKQLGKMKGLIIDVRGNSGGGFDAQAAVRNFNPDDILDPDRPRYKGPIAILIDERCISAGEGWTSWFVSTKRAKLFGATTSGASARKEPYPLTNGLFTVVVSVKAYTGSLDRPIERRGLEPDVPVKCTAKDLAAGRDTVLEAARQRLLAESKR